MAGGARVGVLLLLAVLAVLAVRGRAWTVETVCTSFDGRNRARACPVPYRMMHAMATAHDAAGSPLLYLYGGNSRVEEPMYSRSDVWVYNTSSGAWREALADWREAPETGGVWADGPEKTVYDVLQPLPRAQYAMSTAAAAASSSSNSNGGDSAAFTVVGGYECLYDMSQVWLQDAWQYSAAQNRWARLARDLELPERTAAVVVNSTLYAFGGMVQGELTDELLVVDLADAAAPAVRVAAGQGGPEARLDHSADVVGSSKVAVFGGMAGGGIKRDLWLLDLATRTWEQLPCDGTYAPSSRYQHASAVCQADEAAGRPAMLVVLGGRNSNDPLNDMWVYNFSAEKRDDAWVFVATFGSLSYSAVACVDGVVYVSAGEDISASAVVNSLYRVDLNKP